MMCIALILFAKVSWKGYLSGIRTQIMVDLKFSSQKDRTIQNIVFTEIGLA